MNTTEIGNAASIMLHHWNHRTRIDALPQACRPSDRSEGYAIQAQMARLSAQPVLGWKIAATSVAGQKHIHVDGPLAGRLLADRVLQDGADVSLAGNTMLVAEAEFAFRVGRALPVRTREYEIAEVMDAIDTLHPAIEIPDTRYADCTRVGAAQLIADNACAAWFVLGKATNDRWRDRSLAEHGVTVFRNGRHDCVGQGANVLGDPRAALAWIANELRTQNVALLAGDVVTTGTCVVPFAIAPGDRILADFGALGTVTATMTA